jgi:hypothetical protein
MGLGFMAREPCANIYELHFKKIGLKIRRNKQEQETLSM